MGKIVETLTEFTTNVQFKDMPKDVVHETKRVLLDSIGCAIAGHSMDLSRISVELAKRLGGPPESTIIGTRDRVSCANAAFANGQLINALDFDAGSAAHDTPLVIAAALAVAESTQATGEDVILAVGLSHEIATRLMRATGGLLTIKQEGPECGKAEFAEVFGYASTSFAAAASAGKLLNLNREKMANAIGIAGYICPPNVAIKFLDVSPVRMTKYHVFGWGAQAGVTSALLAEKGFTGDTEVFEGKNGFWKYTGFREWNANLVVEDIGEKWLHKINYKHYPMGF